MLHPPLEQIVIRHHAVVFLEEFPEMVVGKTVFPRSCLEIMTCFLIVGVTPISQKGRR